MITFFSIPRGFSGKFKTIQENSIASWTKIKPRPQILLFGNEPGTREVSKKYGAFYIPDIPLNRFGTPLLQGIFDKAATKAKHDYLCFINTDIIIDPNLPQIVNNIAKKNKKFLIVGQRLNYNMKKIIKFQNKDWWKHLQNSVAKHGTLRPPTEIDYLIFNKRMFRNIPPFAVGRSFYDGWLIWKASSLNIPVIDATKAITAIHQNHPFRKTVSKNEFERGEEFKNNMKLSGGYHHFYPINDSSHVLDVNGKIHERGFALSRVVREIKRAVHALTDRIILMNS